MKQKQILKRSWHNIISLPASSEKEEKLRIKKSGSGFNFLKTFVVAIVVFLGNAGYVKAQFQLGINGGVNASTMSALGNLGDDNALKIGFNSGLIARYQINNWLAFKSGVAYQQKGEKLDDAVTKNEITSSLNYLIIPAKTEFSTGEKAGLKNGRQLFFATGPYIGYLLDAKQKISGNTSKLIGLNDVDFGWNFELGFEFPVMKTGVFQVSLNYDMGISDIVKDIDSQNKTASLNFGLLF